MNKKKIFAAVLLVSAGCTAAITPDEDIEQTAALQREISEAAAVTVMNSADSLYNKEDPASLSEWSDVVAVVCILSNDGSDNYNENLNAYGYVYTYGTFETAAVLKGELPEGTNQYTVHGGTISYEQYIKSLNSEQIEKQELLMKEKPELITEVWEKEITAEPGKMYLAFMTYNDHTPRAGAYNLIGYEGGLREIRTDESGSLETALVYNPFTEEWDKLSAIKDMIH